MLDWKDIQSGDRIDIPLLGHRTVQEVWKQGEQNTCAHLEGEVLKWCFDDYTSVVLVERENHEDK